MKNTRRTYEWIDINNTYVMLLQQDVVGQFLTYRVIKVSLFLRTPVRKVYCSPTPEWLEPVLWPRTWLFMRVNVRTTTTTINYEFARKSAARLS